MKIYQLKSLVAISFAGLAVFSSCVVDNDFNISNFDEIDTEVTLFGGGLSVPVGKTEQIHLSDALKMAEDTSLTEFLKKDDEGKYSIQVSGDYDMSDVIAQMELEKLLDLDGATFSENLDYPLGDFDKEKLTIQGSSFQYTLPGFDPFDLDDIKIPAISCPEQVIYTELYKYMPEGLDIGGKFPKMDKNQNLISIREIDNKMPSVPGFEDTEVEIQPYLKVLGYESVAFTGMQEPVSSSISLGEKAADISDINNFKLQSGGTVTISLSVLNCPMTKGKIIPNVKANLSDMVVLKGALENGDIDLSELVLNETNGYSNTKNYTITNLAKDFPSKKGDYLAIDGTIDIKSGTLDISGAYSTKNKVSSLSSEYMIIRAVISVNDVVLESMDITLGNNVGFEFDPVDMPVEFSCDKPEELEKVSKISLNQSNPMLLEITASNLVGIKTDSDHLSLIPEVEVTFPEGMEVEEADPVTRKLTVTGDLYEGNISKYIHVLSLTPVCSDSKISYSGNVKATIKAKAQGSFNSKTLPKTESDDVVLRGKITCEPKVSDFNATLDMNEVKQEIEETEEFSIDVKGLGDFGEFEIYPKTACSAIVTVDISSTYEQDEQNVVADKIIVTLPEMVVVDGNSISGFNPADNTITIDGEIPPSIEIPIKYLKVKPSTEPGGSTTITGYLTIKGAITVDNEEITNETMKWFKALKGKMEFVMPTVQAGSIKMVGDFSKSMDYECKDVVFLDKTTISKLPKEVQAIKNLDFDGVNAIVQITLDGLPSLKSDNYFHLQNTSVILPDFLTAHDGSNTVVFDKDIRVANNTAVITKAVIGGIRDVNLVDLEELKGDIVLKSTLYSEKPDVNLETLQSHITGTVKVALGDGTGIMDPGKITIGKAVVNVSYDVSEENVVKLGNIPSELQGEDVNLALNPEIRIDLKTNFGAPLVGSFVFVPYINGEALEDCMVQVNDIAMPVSEDATEVSTTYLVGSNPSSGGQGVVYRTCDLSPLMRRIPDEIKLYVNAVIESDKDCIIYPSAKYTCKMDYAFNVPLCFSDDLNLNLTSLIDVDSSTGEYFKYGSVRLDLDVINTLPLGVKCEVKLLDDKGLEVELKEPVILDIKPGDGNTETVQKLQAEVNVVDRTNTVVKNLSLNFTADASAGVNISDDQYLQVTSMTATLPEGITVKPEMTK